jgi:hypothetical protein
MRVSTAARSSAAAIKTLAFAVHAPSHARAFMLMILRKWVSLQGAAQSVASCPYVITLLKATVYCNRLLPRMTTAGSTRAALDTTTSQCRARGQRAAGCWLLIITIATNNEPRGDAQWEHPDQQSNSGWKPDSNERIIKNPAAHPHECFPLGDAARLGSKHDRQTCAEQRHSCCARHCSCRHQVMSTPQQRNTIINECALPMARAGPASTKTQKQTNHAGKHSKKRSSQSSMSYFTFHITMAKGMPGIKMAR